MCEALCKWRAASRAHARWPLFTIPTTADRESRSESHADVAQKSLLSCLRVTGR